MSIRPVRVRSWRDITIAAVVGAAAVVLVVAALGGLAWAALAKRTTWVEVATTRVAFAVELPADAGLTDVTTSPPSDECQSAVFESTYGGLVFEAVARDCTDRTEGGIGNGHHGRYRTLDDVPKPEHVEHVGTDGLGDAVVFTQQYYECTNSCSTWDEPVVIVTLETPVDPEYSSLVVRSEKAELDRDDVTEIVRTMSEPT